MAPFPSLKELSDFVRAVPNMVVALPRIIDRFDDLATDIERVAVAAESLAQTTEPVRAAQVALADAQGRFEERVDNVADRVRRGRAAATEFAAAARPPRRPRKPKSEK